MTHLQQIHNHNSKHREKIHVPAYLLHLQNRERSKKNLLSTPIHMSAIWRSMVSQLKK